MSTLHAMNEVTNRLLSHVGVQVIHARTSNPSVASFIPAKRTIAAARNAGMSLGDYIDQMSHQVGATAATVEAIIGVSGLSGTTGVRICEIGAGSGRYAEKLIAMLHPVEYQVYETATDWLPTLRSLPNVVVKPCDGRHLAETRSESIDLVHANKLFVYVPFHVTLAYLNEMARVVRVGGTVAFDAVTERCMDDATVDEWVRDGTIYMPTPREWMVSYLASRSLELVGSQLIPLAGHSTELFVLRKS